VGDPIAEPATTSNRTDRIDAFAQRYELIMCALAQDGADGELQDTSLDPLRSVRRRPQLLPAFFRWSKAEHRHLEVQCPCGSTPTLIMPPFTNNAWPVTKEASSETRKASALARSSGKLGRPIACMLAK
jgi:hypothetical protein